MGKFLAIYHGAASEQDKTQVTASESEAFMKAWADWAQKHKDVLVDPGAPLYKKKLVTTAKVEDIEDTKTGYTVIEAESHEDAVQIFKDHPHLSFFKGNSIEVIECPPVPDSI